MPSVVFIGYGAMARKVHRMLPENVSLVGVIASPASKEKLRAELPSSIEVATEVSALSYLPDLVVEMAGQQGLKAHALAVLERGISLGIISVGGLTEDSFAAALEATARAHQAKIYVLSGAVGGIDALASAKALGLDSVTYQGRKPPNSWKGSPAEKWLDLDNLHEATVFFQGTAREAAATFPKNANVAATVALAGVGLDATHVRLIADPAATKNEHHMTASGAFGKLEITLQGNPLAENPKTSALAALSVLRLCSQLAATMVI